MCALLTRLAVLFAVLLLAFPAAAQEAGNREPRLKLPDLNGFKAGPKAGAALPALEFGNLTLTAELVDKGPQVTRGLIWRVFGPQAGKDGKLPLIASARGGTSVFQLQPGSYLVHASYGRAGATKRITVGKEPKKEVVVLDAGGLKLDAVLPSGGHIPPDKLRFSIYEAEPGPDGERALIIPDVRPDMVVRLNAGTYHVISKYGSVNAVIRSDIRVTAGKLTEATIEHRAAELTMKLVREHGGEAIADTSWSVLTDSGDVVRESVGAFATMVLAEGDYTIVAKNRDHVYQRELTVEAGHNEDVEVLTSDTGQQEAPIGDISD
ncbi:MAG: hypothetical protein BGN87_03665 [Rhizobiales bacterium 65-79]|jgi:hypothetical protein|nr:hypothetical protein [Hyphomicrobiales bacterium]OJU04873.1 MAG: hypothetical protein BGN87_03665 [Rhizobiales bacterium 65-79]